MSAREAALLHAQGKKYIADIETEKETREKWTEDLVKRLGASAYSPYSRGLGVSGSSTRPHRAPLKARAPLKPAKARSRRSSKTNLKTAKATPTTRKPVGPRKSAGGLGASTHRPQLETETHDFPGDETENDQVSDEQDDVMRLSSTPVRPSGGRIVCDCSDSPSIADGIVIVCARCHNLQHPACAMPKDSPGTASTPPHCNNCTRSELRRRIAINQRKMEELTRLVKKKRAEAQHFVATVLWKHYCNLPKGRSSQAVVAVTEIRFDRGAIVPMHEAPDSWVDEIRARLLKMMSDAGKETIDRIIGSNDFASSHSSQGLVKWRELAHWMLHRGPYKRRTAELGILAEVLGLEEKGTFWDGGWMDNFLNPPRVAET